MAYKRLGFEERVKIVTYRSEGWSYSEIASKLERSKSTICREWRRFPISYLAEKAQRQARFRATQHRGPGKLELDPKLLCVVLAGLRKRWSPDQISRRLRLKYPEDRSMQISRESIYTYIYVLPRGELRLELISLLRQRKSRRDRRQGPNEKRGKISDMISIEERPKSVESRTLAGDWEGDIIIGKRHKTALGTLVERKTRAVILVPLKKKTAPDVRRAFEKAVRGLPSQMKISLTYDQGHEMAEHRLFTENTKMKVYFCHPSSPWERGTCENTNGLIRGYFPKGTDFSLISKKELRRVQKELNERPRKALGYRTPKEALNAEVLQIVPLEP